MKALTLYEPWATLIRTGKKTIETRSWGTQYRGPLAIHAGKKKADVWACGEFGLDPKAMHRGEILCIVNMIECYQFDLYTKPKIPDDQLPYGDFHFGRFGHVYEMLYVLARPIAVNGQRLFWEWKGAEWRDGNLMLTEIT